MFASRALTRAEPKYSQIEREGLGIIFGVKRFYPSLFGSKFTLVTDNKPLAAIISPRKYISADASIDEDVSVVLGVGVLPVTSEQIKVGVRKDPLLSQVMSYTRDGWPDRLPTERLDLQPYFSRRNEMVMFCYGE